MNQFKLYQQFCLRAVLIFQSPCAAASPIPAVCKLKGQFILSVKKQSCHIIGLILDTLTIIGMPGGKDKVTDASAIEAAFVNAAGSGIQPRFDDIFDKNRFAEAIYRITLFFIHCIIAGNPLCFPVGRMKQSHFKYGRLRPVARHIIFIPQTHPPFYAGT